MLERVFGWFKKASPAPRPSASTEDWTGTTREQWTIPGVYFDAAGWRLSEATRTRMAWRGAFGGTMTLTCEATAVWTAADLNLDSVRAEQRAMASARGGGLVSAEFVGIADGALALESSPRITPARDTGSRADC